MSKLSDFVSETKKHWKTPDTENGKYVCGREYIDIFIGVGSNYAAQDPLKYISFAASCYLIMYHYNLPYLAFSVIALIGIPLSYLWNILSWLVMDNLGILEKKTEAKMNLIYIVSAFIGLSLIVFDISLLFNPSGALIAKINGISGVSARSFFKIFGVQLFINGFGGFRDIFWRKKLVPKHGRYKYSLYANVIQKCVMIVLIGWLPVYSIKNVDERVWISYLLFSLFTMYDFSTKLQTCSEIISPNSQERMWIRSYPVKLCHVMNSVLVAVIPLLGKFDDINFYRYVIPGTFIPFAVLTMIYAGKIKERIPQPPIEKKQKVPFWYGIFQVMRNKYRWLDMASSMLDTLGNGMLGLNTVVILYTMRLSGIEYSLICLLYTSRTTIPAFIAPYFIKRFSYKQIRVFKQIVEVVHTTVCIVTLLTCTENIKLCGIILFASLWLRGFLTEVGNIARADMNIRLSDYQMYLSGERLEGFSNVFNWIISPIATLVGLIIPLLLLKNGFNTNWNILFFDSARAGILVIPLIFDLVGHVLMIIPYLFWDYNKEQHEYVIDVLKQREALANEDIYPGYYDGSLVFAEPDKTSVSIPVDIGKIYDQTAAKEALEV